MDDPERECHLRDTLKYNEFHKDGQKEDRTTAEIIAIATSLEDGALISCTTWLWPNMRLSINLDNRPYNLVRDHDYGSIQRRRSGPWRNSFDMSITDVVECFGLDDENIKNPEPVIPGTWSGRFLLSYQGPRPDNPGR